MADALTEMCSTELAEDVDADRATVVIHAPIEALQGTASALIAGSDAPLGPSSLQRVLCDYRFELVADGPGEHHDPFRIGRTSRTIPAPLVRQLRWRDRTCRFPGCERRRWVHGHHIQFWSDNGQTNIEDLVLLCQFHHQLVHDHGWKVTGHPDRPLDFIEPHGRT